MQDDLEIGLFQQRYLKLDENHLKQEEIGNNDLNSKLVKNFEILNGNSMTRGQLSLYNIISRYIDFYGAGLTINCTVLHFIIIFNIYNTALRYVR